MRTRRSDGFWIVLLGLMFLIAALSALPRPPAGSSQAGARHLNRPSSA